MKNINIFITVSIIFFMNAVCAVFGASARISPIDSTADILYVSNQDTGSRRCKIYAMSVDGSNVQRVTFTDHHHFIIGIDDSRRFIVASRAEQDTDAPAGLGDEDRRSLWVIDLGTEQETRLTDTADHAEGDSFSPDGEWIVFHMKLSGETLSDIYKIRRDGTQLIQLTDTDDAIESDPSWSHGGGDIAFAYLDAGTPRFVIKKMDVNGSNIRDVYDGGAGVSNSNFPAGNYDPTWSPDDEWITYERAISLSGENWGNGIWHIFKVRSDGSENTDLSLAGSHSQWAEFLPSFSPDGNFIVFASYYDAPNPVNSLDDVLIMSAAGGSVSRITANPTSDKYPVWIPEAGSGIIGERYLGAGIEAYNIPNPFNLKSKVVRLNHGSSVSQITTTGTVLQFKLPTGLGSGIDVDMNIYNIAGEMVRELYVGNIVPGRIDEGFYYYIEWDGKNNSGYDCASGVYICVLKAADLRQTVKMAIVR